nr:hypothetical protein [Tanacetum cinerariifolium]
MTDAKYNSQDENAHSTILLSLSDEVLYEVVDEETDNGVWKKLEKLYMTKSLTNKLLLKERLFSLRMKKGATLKDHLDALDSVLMNLENVEVKIDDEDATLILLVLLAKCDVVLSVVDYKCTPLVWIMDSSSFHMSPNQDWFVAYEEFDGGHVFMDHEKILISLGVLDSNGFKYNSESSVLRVSNGALVVMKASKGASSLYTLQGETIIGSAYVYCSEKSNLDLTMLRHMRLDHVIEKGMIILRKRGLLNNHKVANLKLWEHSVIRKQKRVSFSKVIHQTKATLDYLHSVCWGPSRVSSLSGARYIFLIVDDFSRVMWVFLMKPKSEAFKKFKHWKILIENQIGRKVKCLRTDNAERMNITLLERTRRLLLSVRLDRSFWAEALNTACYLINRSPVTAIDCKNPIEVWCGKPVDYSKLCVFGCPVYYHVSEGLADPDVTSPDDQSNSPHLEHDQYRSIAHDIPRKNTKAPSRYGFKDYVAYALQVAEEVESLELVTYREAITSKESDMLSRAMCEKIESVHKNNTWELVQLPER